MSVTTGRWVRVPKVSGVINSVADRVMIQSIPAPADLSRLISSHAL